MERGPGNPGSPNGERGWLSLLSYQAIILEVRNVSINVVYYIAYLA